MTSEVKVIVAYTDGSDIAASEVHRGGTGSGIHGYGYNTPISEQALNIYKQKKLPEVKENYAVVAELPECIGDVEYHNIPKHSQKPKEISINDLDLVLLNCHHPQRSATSQVGELVAFIDLFHAPIKATKEYIIHTDSNYLKQGILEWMENWNKRGWIKSNGGPVENLELWKEIYRIVHQLKDDGVILTLRKIKGHSGRFGNEEADKLAGMGSSLAVNLSNNQAAAPSDFNPSWEIGPYRIEEDEAEEVVSSKKDKAKDKKSASKATKATKPKKIKDEEKFIPIPLRQKYLYMVGGENVPTVNVEGENLYRYYGGDHAKLKDDRLLLGKAYPDSIQYVTLMHEENRMIQRITDEAHNRTWHNVPLMYRSNLVYLLNGTFMNQEKFNQRFYDNPEDMESLMWKSEYNELLFDENNWVSVACKPPMLSYRAMDLADTLSEWYVDFVNAGRESNEKYGVTDITDLFFGDKGKPTTFYRSIDKAIKLKAPVPGKDETIDIIVPRNIAIPDRTYLNRMAKYNLKMYLVTRKETKNAFRYYLILETDQCRQLIISYYSSLRIHQ